MNTTSTNAPRTRLNDAEAVVRAFLDGRPACRRSTKTDGRSLWLHHNKIAQRVQGGVLVSTGGGWNTRTTASRLSDILSAMGRADVRARIQGGVLGLDFATKWEAGRIVARLREVLDDGAPLFVSYDPTDERDGWLRLSYAP